MKKLLFSGVLALLAACTAYAPRQLHPGDTADAAIHELGAPTGRHVLPDGGSRLEFARGPQGKHTYMVDLDSQGNVTGWEQVLTDANFARVRPGQTADQVLTLLGRPSEWRTGWRDGELWSYRYETVFCQWFQLSLDAQGRVDSAGYAPDPQCDVNIRESNDR